MDWRCGSLCVKQSSSGNWHTAQELTAPVLCDDLEGAGMGGVGGRPRKEEVYVSYVAPKELML